MRFHQDGGGHHSTTRFRFGSPKKCIRSLCIIIQVVYDTMMWVTLSNLNGIHQGKLHNIIPFEAKSFDDVLVGLQFLSHLVSMFVYLLVEICVS